MKKFLLKMVTKDVALTDEQKDMILDKVIKESKKLVKRNKLIQYNLKMDGTNIKDVLKKRVDEFVSKLENTPDINEYVRLASWCLVDCINNLSIRKGISMYSELSVNGKVHMDNIMYDIQLKMCQSTKDNINSYFTLKFVNNYKEMRLLRSIYGNKDSMKTELTFFLNDEIQQFIMNGIITCKKKEVPTFLVPLKYCKEDFTEN